ncbi:hypothetical protein [Litchfieldella xinjiangensis]|uniref:hypothetical protein n=1 Tax=Litchfieldella xinjiangensis TaxID=1166948 RepID=UPI0005B82842|nr:hypothetical protein [Halomonas xinjiangensis]
MKSAISYLAQPGWLECLGERLFATSMPTLLTTLRNEAGSTYRAMIRDLETPLAPAFELEVSRSLTGSGRYELNPAATLMPVMMQRMGLSMDDCPADTIPRMARTCSNCPQAGRCWLALRASTSAETCRGFCPNTPNFEEALRVSA